MEQGKRKNKGNDGGRDKGRKKYSNLDVKSNDKNLSINQGLCVLISEKTRDQKSYTTVTFNILPLSHSGFTQSMHCLSLL
jgi:hypothetical protein